MFNQLHFLLYHLQYLSLMQKPEAERKQQLQATDSHWSEHIKTLIAIEIQFVYRLKPQNEQKQQANGKKVKKKKNVQYESGFLFAGRKQNKKIQGSIEQMIQNSHCNCLKKLFAKTQKMQQEQKKEGMCELKKMFRIMLELKHSTIVEQFLELYEQILKKIEKVPFKLIQPEEHRMREIKNYSQEIANVIKSKAKDQHFKQLASYMSRDERQMIQFIKINVYCFLAEMHNFNINEYYAAAFTFEEAEERLVPKKKRKCQ